MLSLYYCFHSTYALALLTPSFWFYFEAIKLVKLNERYQELFVFPRENKKLRMVYHQEFFVFPESPRYQITEYSSPHGLLMKILGMSFAVASCPISVEITSTVRIKSKGMLFISEIPLPFFVSNLVKILGPSGPGSPLQWNTFWLMSAIHMDNINNVPFSPYQESVFMLLIVHCQ